MHAAWRRSNGASTSYSTSGPVSTGMGDRLLTGKPSGYISHPGQLSLLPSARREKSTGGDDALRLGVQAGMAHFLTDARAGGR